MLGVMPDVIEEEGSTGQTEEGLAAVLEGKLHAWDFRVVSLDGAGLIVPDDGTEFRRGVPLGAVRVLDDVLHAAILDRV